MNANYQDLVKEYQLRISNHWLKHRNEGDIKWTTKDGIQVPIKDMSDEHLSNAIRMIERNNEEATYEVEIALDNLGGDWQG